MQVMGAMRRRGVQVLLLILPDGSRSLVPASWTDWEATGGADQAPAISTNQREPSLGSFVDLLHARIIVDALLGRIASSRPDSATAEESGRATEPDTFRTSVAAHDAVRAARSRGPR
jgi:hypothetical protein